MSEAGDNKISVLIPEITGGTWIGGELYFKNLKTTVTDAYSGVDFIAYPTSYSPQLPMSVGSRIARKIKGQDFTVELNRSAGEYFNSLAGGTRPVIFSNSVVKYRGNVPYIFWVPDFQFLHLTEFAQPAHIEAAKTQVRAGVEKCDLVMLSSENAKQDFISFLPEYSHKVRVVPFAKKIDTALLAENSGSIRKKYNLPEKFFYLPNQFWKHKNQKIVFEALSLLEKRGKSVFVVFSGNINDFRTPHYFNELLTHISTSNIRQFVAILGIIPYPDVIALIRESVAVLNPSLFEGWSTTVEEVKSIGKPMILSDLEVHKEQAHSRSFFFDRKSAEDLAFQMEKVWSQDVMHSGEIERQAFEDAVVREKVFADKFMLLVNEAIGEIQKKKTLVTGKS